MRGSGLRIARGIVLSCAIVACAEAGPEGVPASIAFDSIPYPAVVLGDSLRNADGLAVPLRAEVFDARNRLIPDAPVSFVSLDTTVTITEDGFVIGEVFGTARILASVIGLQAPPRTLQVTRRPDTVYATGSTAIVLEYATIPPFPAVMDTLEVLVGHLTPPEPPDTVVPGWIVQFEIPGRAPMDTTHGYLVRTETITPASADTTGPGGRASVRFRLNPVVFPVEQDTVEVVATTTYKGEPVPGSPIRFVVIIRPAPPP